MIQNLCIELKGQNTPFHSEDKVALANKFLKTDIFGIYYFQKSYKVEKKIGFEKVQLQLVMNPFPNTSIDILFYVFSDSSPNTLDNVKKIPNKHNLILVRTYYSEQFKDPFWNSTEIEQYASQNSIPFHHIDLSNEKAVDDFFTQSVENYLKKQNTCYLVFNKDKRTINTEQSQLENLGIQYRNLGNKFLFWQKNPERTTQLDELNKNLSHFFQSKKQLNLMV